MSKMKVRYKGAADRRILPAKDLKDLGVTGVDKDLEFHGGNLWSIEMDVDEKLEEILRADGAFTLRAVKDSGDDGDEEVTANKTDDTAGTVVMSDTGQVDKKNTNAPLSSETGSTTTPDTNVAKGK